MEKRFSSGKTWLLVNSKRLNLNILNLLSAGQIWRRFNVLFIEKGLAFIWRMPENFIGIQEVVHKIDAAKESLMIQYVKSSRKDNGEVVHLQIIGVDRTDILNAGKRTLHTNRLVKSYQTGRQFQLKTSGLVKADGLTVLWPKVARNGKKRYPIVKMNNVSYGEAV